MRWTTIRDAARTGVVIVLVVIVAVGAVGGGTVGPEQEPNNGSEEAQEIALGEEVTGELTSGDVDWFRFSVERGEVINISATSDEVGNTNFELIDVYGNQRASASGLTDQSAFVGATSQYTGTYYLRVERRFTDRGGEYSFTVETTDTDGFEPNEGPTNATALTDEQEVTGEMTISDADWFSVTVEEGDTINLSAFGDASGVTNFQVYDRNVSLIAGQDGVSGGFARVNVTASYTGAYYVRVAPRFGGTYGAAYNLTVDLPGAPPADGAETAGGASDSGLPIIPVAAGAVVVGLLVVVWRRRNSEDSTR